MDTSKSIWYQRGAVLVIVICCYGLIFSGRLWEDGKPMWLAITFTSICVIVMLVAIRTVLVAIDAEWHLHSTQSDD